jgi:uncharacterized protein
MKNFFFCGLCVALFCVIVQSERPAYKDRKFKSKTIDKFIEETASKMKDKELAKIFTNTFPNTLDTTVFYDETKKDTFIIT